MPYLDQESVSSLSDSMGAEMPLPGGGQGPEEPHCVRVKIRKKNEQ